MPNAGTLVLLSQFWPVCAVTDTIMELVKCLFGVVVILACDVTARQQWMAPVEKVQPKDPLQQPNVSPPVDSVDKCQVEEGQKIRCGTRDVTAEQCEKINCCFDGSQCYYGKAGERPLLTLSSR